MPSGMITKNTFSVVKDRYLYTEDNKLILLDNINIILIDNLLVSSKISNTNMILYFIDFIGNSKIRIKNISLIA